MQYPSVSMEKAISELAKLPGIGRKSAQRLVFYLLKLPKYEVQQLADALYAIKEKVNFCTICFNITETDLCHICASDKRDRTTLCVVEEANDVLALEKTGEYNGLFHVLGGALSPLEGIGPNDLHIKEMMTRLNGTIQEIIIATNPNTEGEATSLYLEKLIKPLEIKLTRIARGLPVGGDLEYADEITLTKALEGRVVL
ncbi:recombination protein RecR [candidate division KSB1 bacterium]|nr:recombination protein RecR [candidate division KSB1 bacterium]TDI79873.1 MAG: recombination protein RecR [Caldithrix sp.]TDI92449.1 MAG: recombination protein RecR [Caldithrix sp.]TDI97488.1 MAG: recombination protein RecR [Caldithrix sp.]